VSRGGARALTATIVASVLLLGATAIGSSAFPARRAVGWWAAGVLAGIAVCLAIRQRSRRPDAAEGAAATNSMGDMSGVAMQAGSIGRVEFHQHPPVTRAADRVSVGRRPPRAGAFQNREVLDDLVVLFGADWRGGVAILQGPAGVGKSQAAAEYARRVRESCSVSVWVDATSRDSILHGLSRAIPGADDRDVRRAANRTLDLLDGTDQPWLVVLDDLRDPRDLDGLWPPHTPYGQVVVTTRLRDVAIAVNDAHTSDVESFTPAEAVAFLTESLARQPTQARGAAELAEAMGNHPLGLAQAAAYIAAHRDMTCAMYLALLDGRRQRLSDGLPRDHREAIAATWSLSIEHANQVAPHRLARPLLTLASILHAQGTPADVFTSVAALRYLRTAVGHVVGEQDVRDTLSCLHRFSLITYEPGVPAQAVAVHALVQRVVYDTMTRREIARAVRAMADTLVRIWPRVEIDRDLGAVLRANAMAVRNVVGIRIFDHRVRALWFRVGHSLGECGQAAAAQEHFQEVVDASRRTFGPRGHFTLQARLGLAHWQGEAGDPAGAVSALKQLIQDAPQRFRFQRELKLTARRALARWLTDAKDPVCALAEADSVTDAVSRVFGDAHLQTLYARNVRARCLAAVGHPGCAADEMDAVVKAFRSQREPDDPDTLSARNNLAGMYHRARDYSAATAEYMALLPDLCRVFGPYHPKTLRTRNNLARCRIDACDAAVSVSDLRQLVADCDRVLGPSHPETLVAWDNLSRSFAKACR
jgi:hypothetical protein